MESPYVTCKCLRSRKEVNKQISLLKRYYIYGSINKEFIINIINLLREYKNINFPKPSLVTRLLRYIH